VPLKYPIRECKVMELHDRVDPLRVVLHMIQQARHLIRKLQCRHQNWISQYSLPKANQSSACSPSSTQLGCTISILKEIFYIATICVNNSPPTKYCIVGTEVTNTKQGTKLLATLEDLRVKCRFPTNDLSSCNNKAV
jgi:hypothetical protein